MNGKEGRKDIRYMSERQYISELVRVTTAGAAAVADLKLCMFSL